MCDYSLAAFKSRPAEVGDKLVTKNFGSGTRGFASFEDEAKCPSESTAVCVLPGTELSFDAPIVVHGSSKFEHSTAIFRQINKESKHVHHDCLELPNGEQLLLTFLVEGQRATVLQLPATPKTEQEAIEQKRVEYAG